MVVGIRKSSLIKN